MHTHFLSFTLLTFYSVAVSAGLQEELNLAKYIAYKPQGLPNSCVFIMNSMENNEVRRRNFVIWGKKIYSDFESSNAASLIKITFLE